MIDADLLAGRFKRLLATGVDAILVPSLTIFLVMITGVMEHAEDYTDNWWMLHIFLLAVLSYLILNGYTLWQRGQTLGKMLFGIAIVDWQVGQMGSAPLWKLICIRALFFPILFTVVVPWLALLPLIDQLFIFGKQRRCFHDLVASTTVIKTR